MIIQLLQDVIRAAAATAAPNLRDADNEVTNGPVPVDREPRERQELHHLFKREPRDWDRPQEGRSGRSSVY